MKKLILTSPQFNGEVELLYDSENLLVLIDMQNANLTGEQRRYLKNYTPTFFEGSAAAVKASFKSESLHVSEQDFEVTFDMWYDTYGKKRNRERCLKLWDKMTKADRLRAYAGNKPYRRYCAANPWYTQLDPENYLRKKEWLNDWNK